VFILTMKILGEREKTQRRKNKLYFLGCDPKAL